MNVHKNLRRAFVVMAISGLIASANALTPAGTLIRNQASATYQVNGEQYTSTSNEVVTEVLAVYGLDLLLNGQDESEPDHPVVVQHAYVGNEVYFQYEIRSYANTGDTVNITELVKGTSTMPDPDAIYVYEDVNGNGAVDAGEPLVGTWDPATNDWSSVSQDQDGNSQPDIYVPLGESKFFIVSYTIPSTANDGNEYILGVTVQSHGNSSIEDPQSGENGNNYHKVVVSVDASIWANKSAAPQAVAQGDTVTYTISGSNVGGQVTDDVSLEYDNNEDGTPDGTLQGVILKDGINTSYVYFAGGVTGTPSGTPVYFYHGYWHTTAPATAADSQAVDSIGYVFPMIDPGQQFEFSFKVKVRDNLDPDTRISNRAIIEYGRQSANDTTFTTNDVIVTVSGAGAYQYQVFIGPYNHSDAVGGNGGTANTDTAAVDIVAAGSCEYDTVTISNAGNTSDEYDLSYSLGGSGDTDWITSVSFLNMDGSTPIPNNRVTLAAGDSMHVIVRYCVHDTVDVTGTDLDITIRATSVNEPDTYNLTHIIVDSIIGLSVDLGNNDGNPGSVNNGTVTDTTDPGNCVTFPLDVLNNSGVSDVYSLSATLPDNWTVTFYPDEDGDGQADSTVPITQVGPVDPGEEGHVVARVCIPSDQAPNTFDVIFTATSTRDSEVSDNITDRVTINTVCRIDIDPDRHATGFPGGVVTYQHRVINLGNTSVNVTITVSSERGWTYVVLDSAGTGVISSSFPLDVGADSVIHIRAFIPSDAPVGQADIATISVSTGTCTDTVTDVTEVIAGALQLTKWIMDPNHDGTADDSATYSYGIPYSSSTDSGTIWYRVYYKNISTDTVKLPIIYEPIPANTELLDGTLSGTVPAGQLLYSYSTDGGSTWSSWSNSSASWPVANITNIRFGVDTSGDGAITEDDVILSGQTGYIEFKVKIE